MVLKLLSLAGITSLMIMIQAVKRGNVRSNRHKHLSDQITLMIKCSIAAHRQNALGVEADRRIPTPDTMVEIEEEGAGTVFIDFR